MERKRRSFTPEYKAEVVGLIRDGGKAASTVARGLGLTESAVRRWVVQSETDAGRGDGKILTTAERKELSQLRREIRQLRMEREILKKRRPFSPRNRREASIHSGGEGRVSGNADEPDIASWQCSYKRTVFVCRRDAPSVRNSIPPWLTKDVGGRLQGHQCRKSTCAVRSRSRCSIPAPWPNRSAGSGLRPEVPPGSGSLARPPYPPA